MKTFNTFITEVKKQVHELPHDPPAVLILKRKYIRPLINGQRVAVYYSDKLDKYLTLPYEDLQWSSMSDDLKD